MDESKRRFLRNSLYGAGLLGVRAMASGLPIAWIANPRNALAKPLRHDTPTPPPPQFLIFSTGAGGDPLNANVPGTYEDPTVYHPAAASMAPTPITIGSRTVNAALPWTQLDPNILSRTCFFHHGTYTNAHADAAKVNEIMGETKDQQMLLSIICGANRTALNTIQPQPALLTGNLITFQGVVLPVLSPANLQAVLTQPTGPLTQLQAMRDADVDRINAVLKDSGNTAQKALLDKYASSQAQANSMGQTLLSDLSAIKGTTASVRIDQNIAACVLIKMNVTPTVVVYHGFGGDNHVDAGLNAEAGATVATLQALGDLYTRLSSPAYALWDQTTIAYQHVFGRTLNMAAHEGDGNGRNHNDGHHCTVMIGKGFKSSIIGGIMPNNADPSMATDFRGTGISSVDGSINDTGGDVPYTDTLASVGKTLCAACGVPETVYDEQITQGKVVPAALA